MRQLVLRTAMPILAAATVFLLIITASTHAAPSFGWASCDPSVVQSSGYVDIPGVNSTQKHYFYWLFGPRRWPTDGSQPPVVLWMTGGPGSSSSVALFTELGPCLMNETSGQLYRNPYAWNDEAYLLFVDQPTAVGYSYGEKVNYVRNETGVAEDMYHFLQGFARKFPSPSITGANDFYITGESYAGHYAPAVAHRILQGNQRGDGPVINLRGVAIGNGLTDPYTQFPSYSEVAYHWCQEKLGEPCVDAATYNRMQGELTTCLDTIRRCNTYPDDANEFCEAAATNCRQSIAAYLQTGRSVYDIRQLCGADGCGSMNSTIAFLRRAEVLSALGVPGIMIWNSSSPDVLHMFRNDVNRNFNYTFPPLLAAGIRVMIYAGDVDFICNWIGNKAWVQALQWPGQASFNAAPDVEFSVAGRAAGEERAHGNFSFVRIYDAGHMVPMDQPEASLYLLRRFLHNTKLAS